MKESTSAELERIFAAYNDTLELPAKAQVGQQRPTPTSQVRRHPAKRRVSMAFAAAAILVLATTAFATGLVDELRRVILERVSVSEHEQIENNIDEENIHLQIDYGDSLSPLDPEDVKGFADAEYTQLSDMAEALAVAGKAFTMPDTLLESYNFVQAKAFRFPSGRYDTQLDFSYRSHLEIQSLYVSAVHLDGEGEVKFDTTMKVAETSIDGADAFWLVDDKEHPTYDELYFVWNDTLYSVYTDAKENSLRVAGEIIAANPPKE